MLVKDISHLGWKLPTIMQKEAEMHPTIIIHSPTALHFLESTKSTEWERLVKQDKHNICAYLA